MDVTSLFTEENGFLNKKHIIITGHYGTGKTNVAVNLALKLAGKEKVTLIDLDIVNPYFRSSDNAQLLEENGIKVYSPNFANTNLDAPSLPASIYAVFGSDRRVIWDVGGDDDGATALGRFSAKIEEQGYAMLYVINRFRPLTETPEAMEEYLRAIEAKARLSAAAVINNSNLSYLTDAETLSEGERCAEELSQLTRLPVVFTCISEDIHANLDLHANPDIPADDRYFTLKICTVKI